MSEGELYKKARHIRSLVPTNDTEDNNFVPFRDVLDEAKREFPDWKKVPGVLADELSTETLWKNCFEQLKKIDVWIDKWFGGADKIPP